ncbi:unnamed protein product [Mytilus coruscus]|uniref:Uncharacterized protein n=1 Tax=Mytilus coruscus TaxID=42192 RepID=A0A6J8AGH3_MYTCO|nr:unnamed protein product [Mytilus coruscus]
MSDLKDEEVSLEDNSASGDLADELHVDHTADIEEARVSESYVQSDNSLAEKHKKKRKRPKYAKHRKNLKPQSMAEKAKNPQRRMTFLPILRRSVISETVSNLTYSDKNGNKSYHRFNPHKKEKTGLKFSKDMELFLDDNFNRFIASHKVQELILNTMPVIPYEGFTIRSIDPLIFSIMEEQSRNTNTQLDKAFVKQECLAKNDKHLFGSEFKEELKEWSKTKKEASEMALVLGGKKKSHKKKVINNNTPRQVQQSQRWEQKESHQDKPPFQSRPPSHSQGARNSGGKGNSRENGFHRGNKRS